MKKGTLINDGCENSRPANIGASPAPIVRATPVIPPAPDRWRDHRRGANDRCRARADIWGSAVLTAIVDQRALLHCRDAEDRLRPLAVSRVQHPTRTR